MAVCDATPSPPPRTPRAAGAPVVAYPAGNFLSRIAVQQWNGTAWAYLRAPPDPSTSTIEDDTQFTDSGHMALAAAGDGHFLAHRSYHESNRLVVLQYKGEGDWSPRGGGGGGGGGAG